MVRNNHSVVMSSYCIQHFRLLCSLYYIFIVHVHCIDLFLDHVSVTRSSACYFWQADIIILSVSQGEVLRRNLLARYYGKNSQEVKDAKQSKPKFKVPKMLLVPTHGPGSQILSRAEMTLAEVQVRIYITHHIRCLLNACENMQLISNHFSFYIIASSVTWTAREHLTWQQI